MADYFVRKILGLDTGFEYDKRSNRWYGTIYPPGAWPAKGNGIPGGSSWDPTLAIKRTEAMIHDMQTGRARDVDVPPPSSRRVPRTPGAYRFAVTTALVREHRMTDARAGRLVQKWERLVESRRADGRSPSSTAEHVARFESQHLVSPYPRRDRARRRRS